MQGTAPGTRRSAHQSKRTMAASSKAGGAMTALAAMQVTDADLSKLAGVSTRRIRQLAEQGTLVRLGQNRYNLGAAFQALLEDAAGSGSELQRQRTRKVKAEADRSEMELALARKEIAPIADMERIWSRHLGMIRTGMLNLPQRVVTQILGETNESFFKAKLRQEIILVLTAAADTNLEDEPNDDE
jgi:phage terminase Nu1 subunit (DNA packaging protein)